MTSHRPRRSPFLARWGVPLALFVAVVGGASAGILLREAKEPASLAAVPSVPPTTRALPVPASSTPSAPVSTPSPLAESTAPPVTAFGDGAFYVSAVGSLGGDTVAPGAYRSPGSVGCAWERRTGSNIEQDRTDDVVLIALKPGQSFWSKGCGPWTRTAR